MNIFSYILSLECCIEITYIIILNFHLTTLFQNSRSSAWDITYLKIFVTPNSCTIKIYLMKDIIILIWYNKCYYFIV
jgi:hypothetical protein